MFQDKVFYQIYPKSFKDSDDDGIGDINGIISELGYLHYLGVDVLWITPVFVSPQKDNGYDVADYYNIDPIYGTLDDVKELIERASKLDIDIMFDMVFNHSSTDHEWFKRAMNGEQEYKDCYIFKKGIFASDTNSNSSTQNVTRTVANQNSVNPNATQDGDSQSNNSKSSGTQLPPTNWQSKFGGDAWEYVPSLDEWYLHLFDKSQADVNWSNPKVRNEFIKVLNYWIDLGVKGFRFDVINLIGKDKFESDDTDGKMYYTDLPIVHDYLKEINAASFGKDEDIITVGEMSATTIENCAKYAGYGEGELDMVFSFHHLKIDYKDGNKWDLQPVDFVQLKKIFCDWQIGMQKHNAWNALFWSNHDQPRAISRFGDTEKYPYQSGTMLATIIHFMRGSPYIYQGEEIGMTNAGFSDISQYKDVESLNFYYILKAQGKTESEIMKVLQARSRDNARTPMQWDDTKNAGFSQGTPWISVADNYKDINVASEMKRDQSILHYYTNLIRIRKQNLVVSCGTFEPLLYDHKEIFAYKRELDDDEMIVVCNFFSNTVTDIDIDLDGYEIALNNYPGFDLNNIQPYQAVVFLKLAEDDEE